MKIKDRNVSGWLDGFGTRGEMWHAFFDTQNITAVAEIGVWKGDFAAELLRLAPAIEKYYMIDPWANLPNWNKPFNVSEEVFETVLREMREKTDFAAHKRHVLRGRTNEVVGAIPHECLDFAYIDGDHTLRGILIDLISIWPKIRNGGYIGGDDFTNNPWQHGESYEPTLVFPLAVYFAEAMCAPIVALEHGQFLIIKDVDAGFSFTDSVGSYGDLSVRGLRI